jgi:hypothetical protein
VLQLIAQLTGTETKDMKSHSAKIEKLQNIGNQVWAAEFNQLMLAARGYPTLWDHRLLQDVGFEKSLQRLLLQNPLFSNAGAAPPPPPPKQTQRQHN